MKVNLRFGSGCFADHPARGRGCGERSGIILDFDAAGNVTGIEVLNALKRVENPRGMEYAVTA
jgi:hypothetical protein